MPSEDRPSATNSQATSIRRRQLLAAVGATTPLGVAGCFGSDSGTDSSNETDENGTTGTDGSGGDGDGDGGGGDTDGDDSGSDDASSPDSDDTNDAGDDDSDSDDSTDSGSDEADDWAEGGPPDREGWSVTFADRFEGGELDTDKWSFGSGYNVTCAGGSLECWEEDHAYVDGETDRLVIETSDEPSGDREYTASGVTTLPSFEQEFGYFEAKSRAPAVPGGLPAFWMWWNADGWTYRREIDVYEIYGEDATTGVHNVHTDCEHREESGPAEWRGGESTLATPADETFTVWGVEWSPDAVTFYVDGEEVVHIEDDVIADCLAGEAMGILCSTHVNGDMGDPTEAEYPYTHEFEWVRVWQHSGWE